MATYMNIDDSQTNADFTKFKQLDIPGVSNFYQLLDMAGIDHSAEDGPQKITEFVDSHPWLDSLDPETTWIISDARKKAEAENKK